MKSNVMSVLLAFCLFAFLVGCSNSPGDALVEKVVSDVYGSEIVTITDVEHLNGRIDEDGDYELRLRYTAEYEEGYESVKRRASGFEKLAFEMAAAMTGKWREGDTYEETVTIYFVETDDGWKPL